MKSIKICLAALLTICLLLAASLPASAADRSGEIIRSILIYYSHYQENARTDIERLLAELAKLDPELADNWGKVIDGWTWACTQLEIVPEVLPDGLPEDDSLCIVVMGYALFPDGTMRDELLGRLAVTLASAQKYPNAYILCTGGGTAWDNYFATEAGRMARWLEKQGIDPARIIVEDRSYTTEQNAVYSMEILREQYPQVDSLALISSDYHLRQCHLLFRAALALIDCETRYTIAGNAAYSPGHSGIGGFWTEAESLGNLENLTVRRTYAPDLSLLTGITVESEPECPLGQYPSLLVTASYDTDFSRDVSTLAVLSGYDPMTAGTQEVTVHYTENGITRECSLILEVIPPASETAAQTSPTAAPVLPEPPPAAQPALQEEPSEPGMSIGSVILAGLGIGLLMFPILRKKPRGQYQK